MGAGEEGQPSCARVPGDQAGVVLPLGLSAAEGVPAAPVRDGRTAGGAAGRDGADGYLGGGPLAGSPCIEGPALAGVHGPGDRRDHLHGLPHAEGVGHRWARAPREASRSPGHGLGVRVDHAGSRVGDRDAPGPRLPAAMDVLLRGRAPPGLPQRHPRGRLPDRRRHCRGRRDRRGGRLPERARTSAGGAEMTVLLPLLLVLSQTGPAPAADDGKLPASLEALFQEKDKEEKLILGEPERTYLKKLPPHTRELIGKDVDALTVGGARHLKALLALELPSQSAAILFSDNCILCHTDPESQKKIHLFSADPKATQSSEILNLKSFVSDVHFRRGLSCSGCHGGSPQNDVMTADIAARWPKADVRHTDRTWIPEFCARCHADPAFMRGFNPSLPTDQLSKYKDSQHGILLLQQKDSKAAQCVSCHGVHGIRGPKSRQSSVHPQAIPETCGRCHADAKYMAGYKKDDGTPLPTNQLEEFKKSVHGKAL